MTNKSIIIILLALLPWAASGQSRKDSISIFGSVADGFTKAAIPNARVTLMKPDSTVIDTMTVYNSSYLSDIGAKTEFYFNIIRKPQDYIIMVEHPNYETTYNTYRHKQVGKRVYYTHVPTVYMKKKANANHFEGGQLEEVVVKATRVKMIWKGDTLVYNADAFNVQEGSMLDGLIRQLPGVELTDEGEIFVNGKKIDNLMLNGADFFKGKNKVMLDNLPYFTVKNIKVYNRQTDENKFLGINDESKKEFTMDVMLKRQYNIGGTANIEAGGGTQHRYKIKGFGLRYTDRTRAALFGGLNNINETMDYDSNSSSIKDRRNQMGDRHLRQVGGQFVYSAPENKLNNTTEVNASWQDNLTETRQHSETYMNDASSFGQSQSTQRTKPTNISLFNRLRIISHNTLSMTSNMKLGYDRNRHENEGWNTTTADAMMTDSINHSWNRSRSQSDRFYGNGFVSLARKLNNGDHLQLFIDGNFSRLYNPGAWSTNHYDYLKTATTEHRDRYTHSPTHSYRYSGELCYIYRMTENLALYPTFSMGHQNQRSNRHEYLRDEVDYQFDQQNSYEQQTKTLDRKAGLNISFNEHFGDYYLNINPAFRVNWQQQRMCYESVPLTTELKRNYTLYSPRLFMYLSGKNKSLIVDYYVTPTTPTVTDLIDRPITSDPLNIYLGNADLKNSTEHTFSADYTVGNDSIDQTIRLRAEGSIIHNMRVQGYTYDMTTGVRTYRPENIKSGNLNTGASVNWTRALGKQKLFHISNELKVRYDKSTSLALSAGSTASELSRVNNVIITYKPELRYQKDKLTLRLKGKVDYRNIHRNITVGNQPTDIWNFNYGISGTYKLPWNFSIDTDLTMNSRRGYADDQMNDNRIYWDGTLTKSFAKGKWLMKLRGYDLLGQVSSLRYSINAQGRTETWTNSMRRYAMLTISYRFTQKPKK